VYAQEVEPQAAADIEPRFVYGVAGAPEFDDVIR
jgi:hypothetical protein